MRLCLCGCGINISNKHINAKFFNQKHKDKFHNKNNPRGYFAYLNNDKNYDIGDSEYYNNKNY